MSIGNIPYTVSGGDVASLANELRMILSNISDRLDRIEGLRGTSHVETLLEVDGQVKVRDTSDNIVAGFVTETTGL